MGALISARFRPSIAVGIFIALVGAGSVALSAPSAVAATSVTNTCITVNGSGGDRTYQGIGAVLGGGGNARYLMDYPQAQRNQILDYLFKPGYSPFAAGFAGIEAGFTNSYTENSTTDN